MKNIVVTGCAGFIGSSISSELLSLGFTVLGIDSLSSYYDINIKRANLRYLGSFEKFHFLKKSINHLIEKDFNIHTGGDFNIHSRGNINIRSEGSDGINVNVTTGKLQMKSTGNMILQTDADGNIITAGQAVVKSSRLDLNGGSATDAVPTEPGPLTMNTSVLQSICTRVPEHEPWKDHESQKIVPKGEGLTPAWT